MRGCVQERPAILKSFSENKCAIDQQIVDAAFGGFVRAVSRVLVSPADLPAAAASALREFLDQYCTLCVVFLAASPPVSFVFPSVGHKFDARLHERNYPSNTKQQEVIGVWFPGVVRGSDVLAKSVVWT